MLTADQFILAQVALTVWRHGHVYGSHRPMLTIACCLRNRYNAGWGSWLDILMLLPKHHASLIDPASYTAYPDLRDPNLRALFEALPAIYAGQGYEDLADEGLYWADLSQPVTNPWFQKAILESAVQHPRSVSSFPLTVWK